MRCSDDKKVARLRGRAKRSNLRLEKSRLRTNTRHPAYGMYWLRNPYTNSVVFGLGGWGHAATIEEIDAYLAVQRAGR